MQKPPEPVQDAGDNASMSWVGGDTRALILMAECCQRCRALLPASQFFGIRAAAEQRPTHNPRPQLPSSPQMPRPGPLCHLATSPPHRQMKWGKDLGQCWHVQHRNWAVLFVKPFVFFCSSLLSLLPCVALLCMVPSPRDPRPCREKPLLRHHATASRVAGAGMVTFTRQSRDATPRTARRGMLLSSWVGGSPAATQS